MEKGKFAPSHFNVNPGYKKLQIDENTADYDYMKCIIAF
jgi:hypothetical protein